MLFADEAVVAATAATTANTSLILSVCTILLVPVITLIVNKWAESRKQRTDADAARARFEADAVIARAKIEAEASVARAKLEFDSKLEVLATNHAQCEEQARQITTELEHCREAHATSESDRSKIWAAVNANTEAIKELTGKEL